MCRQQLHHVDLACLGGFCCCTVNCQASITTGQPTYYHNVAGWSPFPGNINQLVLKLSSYTEQLAKTGGNISEFVNPKYKDASKTAFKSSTRLECMMQDYPKALPGDARVGFTVVNQVGILVLAVINRDGVDSKQHHYAALLLPPSCLTSISYRTGDAGVRRCGLRCLVLTAAYCLVICWSFQVWATYSPVKNSPADARVKAAEGNPTHSATTGEMDIYKVPCNIVAPDA